MDQDKKGFHPRNRFAQRYDFEALIQSTPELKNYVKPNKYNDASIDFANPDAVRALNRALLRSSYGVNNWDIPAGYLCPPIPGRADYIHHVADLLVGVTGLVRVLDIGIGANCVYPIIGFKEYGWQFVGTDIDPVALEAAGKILKANPDLAASIELRLQKNKGEIFNGVVKEDETFSLSLCNPPFHQSAEEANAGSQRKWRNLGKSSQALNFGGKANELWCEGGERAFILKMINESADRPLTCLWFTTLVSKEENLPVINAALKKSKATAVRTINMQHGQKQSRIIAWSFQIR